VTATPSFGRTVMDDLKQSTHGFRPREAVVEAFAASVRNIDSSRLLRRILIEESALVQGIVSSVREWTVGETAVRVSRTLRQAGARILTTNYSPFVSGHVIT
jgi:hypothetical protein